VLGDNKEIEIINGRFGPYIAYKGKNYKLPKANQQNIEELDYEQCMKIIEEADAKPATKKYQRR